MPADHQRMDNSVIAHNSVIVPGVTAVNPGSAPDVLTQRLVDEAGRLLAERGPGGLSLRRVAEAAGTSTMPVYTRFGSKQGLLAAMHREGFRRLGAALADALAEEDPAEALAEAGRAYRRSALAAPALYGLMFGPPVEGFEPSPDDEAAAAATYQPLVEAVRRCCAAGVLSGDPERIARHLWTVTHGAVSLELAGRLPGLGQDPEDAYEEALVAAAAPFLTRAGD
jgi:AcrR family transcriptional regulator